MKEMNMEKKLGCLTNKPHSEKRGGVRLALSSLGEISPEALLQGIARGGIAFLLGCCRLPFGVYPLGFAFLCASDRGTWFVTLGLIAASFLSSLPLGVYLSAIGITLLMRVLVRLFVDVPIRLRDGGIRGILEHIHGRFFCESLYLRMTCSCVSVFLLSLYAIVAGGFRYYDLFGAFLAMIVAPIATLLYASFSDDVPIGKKWLPIIRRAADVFLAFGICFSLREVILMGLSLGALAVFVTSLILTRREGLLVGLLAAVTCGLSMDPTFIPVCVVASVTVFCLGELSLTVAAGSACILSILAGMLVVGGGFSRFFLPFLLGTGIVCTFEKITVLGGISSIFSKKEPPILCSMARLERQYGHMMQDVSRMGDAFGAMSHILGRLDKMSGNLTEAPAELLRRQEKTAACAADYQDISRIYAGLVDRVKQRYTENTELTAAVRDKLRELGFSTSQVSVCGNRMLSVFVSGLSPVPKNQNLNYLQRQLERVLGGALSVPLLTVDGDSCVLYTERVTFVDADFGIALFAKEEVCGDSVRVFENLSGDLCYSVLSDGMGAGHEAFGVSEVSTTLLEKMLAAGAAPNEALDVLNHFLCFGQNGGAREGTATVDILCLDRLNGKASFWKSGASPTYVKRGTELFRLASSTMPIGILDKLDVTRNDFDTGVGDRIIMMSDGVTQGSEDCFWLVEYLNTDSKKKPQEMADEIRELARQNGSEDDISVIVAEIK